MYLTYLQDFIVNAVFIRQSLGGNYRGHEGGNNFVGLGSGIGMKEGAKREGELRV